MPRYFRKLNPYETKKLGAYLKELRTEIGVSLRYAALETEISPSYLSKIEAGSFSNIGIKALIKLSKTYGVSVEDFLREAGLVEKNDYELPDFPQYLRTKYHLLPQAIRDMQMAKEIVQRKYQRNEK